MQTCSACLGRSGSFINIGDVDSKNIQWNFKLTACVPEVDWTKYSIICQLCVNQLASAYTFRCMCLQSHKIHKEQVNQNNVELGQHADQDSPKYYFEDVDKISDTTDDEHKNVQKEVKVNVRSKRRHILSSSTLKYNLTSLSNLKNIRCKICNEVFTDRKSLTHHNKVGHQLERPYDCLFCIKNFRTCSDLTHHEKIHLNQRTYECRQCQTSYNTPSILRKHNIIKHTEPHNWKYRCPQCDKTFPFKSNCDAHIQRHHTNADGVYICYHCNQSYKSKSFLIAHIRITHSSKKFSKQCSICKNIYINQVVLENHLRKKHNIGNTYLKKRVKQFQCLNCSKLYTTERVMKSHYNSCDGVKRHNCKNGSKMKINDGLEATELEKMHLPVNDEEQEAKESLMSTTDIQLNKDEQKTKRGRKKVQHVTSNKCDICGMVFATKYLVKRHIRNVHATEKNYKCDVCEQKFASPVYLSAHKRYHSGERPHICSFCGKGYITASDLYHHEKIHANKRAYKCEKCPKAFNTSSDLHKHKLCVHQDRSEWKYVCSLCDRRFPLKTNLDAHTKTHTGERNFACHLCDRRCVNRSVLLRHISSHSNVRLYKCSLCSQEYKHQKSLEIHMTKSHGIGDAKIPERVKKYFCHVCPKSYFANNKLQKHIRTHTGERPFSCQMCEKRFIDKSYVKQHLKTAHNVRLSNTDMLPTD